MNNVSIEDLFGDINKTYLAKGEEYKTDASPIKIVAAANGVFEIRECTLGRFVKKLERNTGLDEIKEGFDLNIPLIPFSIFNEMIAWFRYIYVTDKTESTAMVFYNRKEDRFFTWIPTQRNAGATSNYDRGNDPAYLEVEKDNVLVMVAHSHPWKGSNDPGPSGTDNNDEKEALLYLIAGNVEGVPNVYCSTCPGGVRQKLEFFDIFENPASNEDLPNIVKELIMKAPRNDIFKAYLEVESVVVPEEWKVKHTKSSYSMGTYTRGAYGSHGSYFDDWDYGSRGKYLNKNSAGNVKKNKKEDEKEEKSSQISYGDYRYLRDGYYDSFNDEDPNNLAQDELDALEGEELLQLEQYNDMGISISSLGPLGLAELTHTLIMSCDALFEFQEVLINAEVPVYSYSYHALIENAEKIDSEEVIIACEELLFSESIHMETLMELIEKASLKKVLVKSKNKVKIPSSGVKGGTKTKKNLTNKEMPSETIEDKISKAFNISEILGEK